MSQFFISCKESKIENNRSFYGCFNLGPFEPSQSITIANALRRTLLSELYGLSIVSVEIEGATHEYSNLNGIKDSVLDILLNLKEIILKKNSNYQTLNLKSSEIDSGVLYGTGNLNLSQDFDLSGAKAEDFEDFRFSEKRNLPGSEIKIHPSINSLGHEHGIKSQIGYLKARGPGIVRASNLRLPPFIQCVDPDQYIATLAEDGFLNIKFIIQYGNKWASSQNSNSPYGIKSSDSLLKSSKDSQNDLETFQKLDIGISTNRMTTLLKDITGKEENKIYKTNVSNFNSSFNLHLKKRRLILKKLRHLGLKFSNSYINMLTQLKNQKESNTIMYPWSVISPTKSFKNKLFGGEVFEVFEVFRLARFAGAVKKFNNCLFFNKKKKTATGFSYVKTVKFPGINLYIRKKKNKVDFFIKQNFMGNTQSLSPYFTFNSTGGDKISPKSLEILPKKVALILKSRILSTNKINLSNNQLIKENLEAFQQQKIQPTLNSILTYNNTVLKKSTQPFKTLKSSLRVLKQSSKSFKNKPFGNKSSAKRGNLRGNIFLNSNPLTIDAIFNPITKVNYIIEVNDFKTTQNSFQNSLESSELFEILNIVEGNDFEQNSSLGKSFRSLPTGNTFLKTNSSSQLEGFLKHSQDWAKESTDFSRSASIQTLKLSLENILKIKHEINSLKKEIPKHNIILEIWTNGSIHPRDAIYEGLKNLVKLFSKLNKVNAFMINPFLETSVSQNNVQKPQSHLETLSVPKDKKIKEGQIKSQTKVALKNVSDLLPLNETSFLSTYMNPKVKNYYSKKEKSLKLIEDRFSANRPRKIYLPKDLCPVEPLPENLPPYEVRFSNLSEGDSLKNIALAPKGKSSAKADFILDSVSAKGTPSKKKKKLKSDPTENLPKDSLNISTDKTMQKNTHANSFEEFALLISQDFEGAKFSSIYADEKLNKKKILGHFDIGLLNLSLRSYTCLKRLNINTIDELISFLKTNSLNQLSSKTIEVSNIKLSKFSLDEIKRSILFFFKARHLF
jgi:DNA-directed RNA polymerase alpha subunit